MPHKSSHASPLTRRRTIKEAVPSPHLAGVSLPELRAYRRRLVDEEEKVAYWSRLVRARIEMLESESNLEDALSTEELVRVLGDTVTGRARQALLAVRSVGHLPELPVPAEMWDAEIDPHDTEQVSVAVARLRQAEHKLATYRDTLQSWLDEATGELIVRYGEDPARAIGLLPEA